MANDACRDCGRSLQKLYPDAPNHLQWGHISADDAEACPSKTWPVPR
ncbi:hypothetical protein [Mycobacteroides abscessus]